jgi:integrase
LSVEWRFDASTGSATVETLSKMMGHNSIQSTQIYAEITNKKVGDDMKKLIKPNESITLKIN